MSNQVPERVTRWCEKNPENVRKNKAWSHSIEKIHSRSIAKWKKDENQGRVEEIMQYDGVVELLEELDYLS